MRNPGIRDKGARLANDYIEGQMEERCEMRKDLKYKMRDENKKQGEGMMEVGHIPLHEVFVLLAVVGALDRTYHGSQNRL